MAVSLYACRLCLGTESLVDLFEINTDISLSDKITSCVDVKVTTEDMLPSLICEPCKITINRFYDFKLNCLAVEQQLKAGETSNSVFSDVLTKETRKEDSIVFVNENFSKETKDFGRPSILDDGFTDVLMDHVDDMFGFSPLVNNIIDAENEAGTKQSNHIEENNISEAIPNTEIQCEHCGYVFLTKNDFKRHISMHKGKVKSVQCKYCPKSFTRTENAVIHMRSHLGIKPFICDICGQTANKIQTLKRHMKIHSDERNYACPQCGCRFKRSGDLYSHTRIHTGARPYKCKLCANDYTSHSGLRKHYKMRHKNIPNKISLLQ